MPPASDNKLSVGHGRLLLLLAFVGGLTSLGLEIAASRLLAPFFGTSTYIWGALIGLILLYLTVGYYVGGWAADRWPRADYLYRVTAVAAALVLLIPLVSRPILLFSQRALDSFAAGAFVGALVAVILIFAPAVILLGMVSPWVIRLRVDAVSGAGRAAGPGLRHLHGGLDPGRLPARLLVDPELRHPGHDLRPGPGAAGDLGGRAGQPRRPDERRPLAAGLRAAAARRGASLRLHQASHRRPGDLRVGLGVRLHPGGGEGQRARPHPQRGPGRPFRLRPQQAAHRRAVGLLHAGATAGLPHLAGPEAEARADHRAGRRAPRLAS